MARLRFVLLALSVFLLSGMAGFQLGTSYKAPPETLTRPLQPQKIRHDRRLFGVWCSGDKRYLHVRPAVTGNEIDVLAVESGDDARWLSVRAYGAKTPDGALYYVAKRVQGRGIDYSGSAVVPGYVTVRVEFAGKQTMFLHFMSPEFAKEHGKKIKTGAFLFDDISYYYLDLDRKNLLSQIEDKGWNGVFKMRAGPFRKLGPEQTACVSGEKK